MALIRWEPATELNTIQNEMNRLFNSLFETPVRVSANGGARRWIPSMDLVESGDHYVLHADLPGLDEKDVKVELESDVLTISGERKAEHEKGGYHRFERAYGSFSRSLTLPEGVDPEAVEASFERGVLEVRIPKPVRQSPHKVTIAVGAGSSDAVAPETVAAA
ncbi:MAG: Hsp20/alpha crystallin family protein [Acidobacteriota bacterium]|nr:Hsp20/alpha crystallin family protein [Acidobacteriota bacterium]